MTDLPGASTQQIFSHYTLEYLEHDNKILTEVDICILVCTITENKLDIEALKQQDPNKMSS